MKFRIVISILVIVVVALIVFSKINRRIFAPAQDFPRDALVYLQISDLPAFIKLWNESQFRDNYTSSENFTDFTNGHLGLKLARRWQEFNEAAGFQIDLETLSGLTENQASIALYDIGKLEFVFIAPVSDEVFAATKFMQNQNSFTEETLEDGTIMYRADVRADRGRQKQELLFTSLKGRFVLATSEKLLVQTLQNIKGSKLKNRLIDQPSFKALSEKIELHTAAVWVDQTALNNDYYFKHYWLMSDLENLKNIRAGIFDFEMQTGKFIERRRFLLNKAVDSSPLRPAQTTELLSSLPAGIPFYRLQNANTKNINEIIENTVLTRRKTEPEQKRNHDFNNSSFDDNDDYFGNDYSYLGEKFDETINETDEVETVERRQTGVDFSGLFQAANPQTVLTFAEPQVLPAPMFVEFRHGAVFHLASPDNFNRELFESAIEKSLSAQVMISAPDVKLNWETIIENGAARRELRLPMLGWKVIYMIRKSELILTDNPDFLREILAVGKNRENIKQDSSFNKLTVLNLDRKEEYYDKVFGLLAEEVPAKDFFTGNVQSLLDSVSEVNKIEIKEQSVKNMIEEEEISVDFK